MGEAIMIDPTTGMQVPDQGAGAGSLTLPEDPAALQGQLSDTRQAQIASSPSSLARRQMQTQQGFSGTDPRVAQAQQQKQQLTGILADVQATAPENENPLDLQARLSTRIMAEMGSTNPGLAIQASQRLMQIQEAKLQQGMLTANVAEKQQTTATAVETLKEAQYNFAAGRTIPKQMYIMPPPNSDGTPSDQPPIPINLTDQNGDPRTDHAAIANELRAAQQQYPGGVPATAAQMLDSRTRAAEVRLQGSMYTAQMGVQRAMIEAQQKGQAMSGNQAMMTNRILSSTELGSMALQNISEQPFGATTGWLGTQAGAKPGSSLLDMTEGNLRNKLSDNDVQAYSAMSGGLERNLAMVEMQGGMQGGQKFSEQMHAVLALRPGDSPGTIMTKLAEAKQILKTGTQAYIASGRLTPESMDVIQDSLAKLDNAIPFTVSDVTKYRASQTGADGTPVPQGQTYRQWALTHIRTFGSTPNSGEPAPPMPGQGQPGPGPGPSGTGRGPGGMPMTRMLKNGEPYDIPSDQVEQAKTHGYMVQQQ